MKNDFKGSLDLYLEFGKKIGARPRNVPEAFWDSFRIVKFFFGTDFPRRIIEKECPAHLNFETERD